MQTPLLASALGLAMLLAPGDARAQPPQGSTAPTFRIDTLAPGVWVAEVLPRPPHYAFANSLIVELEEGLLVVDTQQSPGAARALIERLPSLSPKPVRWAVATHWHPDHLLGNVAYREAFPGIDLIAHEATAEAARTYVPGWLEEERAALPASIRERERWLETGTGPDGGTLTEAEREAVAYSLGVRRGYLEQIDGLEPALPDRTFRDSLVLGDGRVRILHLGPAHTPGDVVVWLPEERIVAAGDLVEAPLPWLAPAVPGAEGGDVPGWAAALERMLALGPAHVVPSHGAAGPDAGTLELARRQSRLFRAVTDGLRASAAAGEPYGRARAGLDLEASRQALAGTDAAELRRFEDWVDEAACAAWPRVGGGEDAAWTEACADAG